MSKDNRTKYFNIIKDVSELKLLHETEIENICDEFISRCLREQNVVTIKTQVTVVGCLNGQLHDLLNIFKMAGEIPYTNYLFLGDYVNFGQYGLEIYIILMCYKILYPSKVIMLRGQHEIKMFSDIGGFQSECFSKYGNNNVYKKICKSFEYLPVAANIQNKIFCSHGGIMKDVSIENLSCIRRVTELDKDDMLMWFIIAQPKDDKYKEYFKWYERNDTHQFEEADVEKFFGLCKKSGCNFDQVICTNNLHVNGMIISDKRKVKSIWSCTNFLGEFENCGCYIEINSQGRDEVVQYRAPPQYILPKNWKPLHMSTPKAVPDFFA